MSFAIWLSKHVIFVNLVLFFGVVPAVLSVLLQWVPLTKLRRIYEDKDSTALITRYKSEKVEFLDRSKFSRF